MQLSRSLQSAVEGLAERVDAQAQLKGGEATPQEEKILAVLKALVAHLRAKEKAGLSDALLQGQCCQAHDTCPPLPHPPSASSSLCLILPLPHPPSSLLCPLPLASPFRLHPPPHRAPLPAVRACVGNGRQRRMEGVVGALVDEVRNKTAFLSLLRAVRAQTAIVAKLGTRIASLETRVLPPSTLPAAALATGDATALAASAAGAGGAGGVGGAEASVVVAAVTETQTGMAVVVREVQRQSEAVAELQAMLEASRGADMLQLAHKTHEALHDLVLAVRQQGKLLVSLDARLAHIQGHVGGGGGGGQADGDVVRLERAVAAEAEAEGGGDVLKAAEEVIGRMEGRQTQGGQTQGGEQPQEGQGEQGGEGGQQEGQGEQEEQQEQGQHEGGQARNEDLAGEALLLAGEALLLAGEALLLAGEALLLAGEALLVTVVATHTIRGVCPSEVVRVVLNKHTSICSHASESLMHSCHKL
ncbi:unnamed protein product [Closterium sp. Yama58-4]|nr:unnamed protein product [Closterium sp. Yama58-4]